jgi:GAF domain-containing protein
LLLQALSEQLLGASDLAATLELAVNNAVTTLNVEFVAIVLPDDDGQLKFKAWKGWTDDDARSYEQGQGERYQTGFTMREAAPVFVNDYAREARDKNRFIVPDIITDERIKTGLSVPMSTGGEPVGAILVHSRETRIFTEAEARVLTLIANLTAIAYQHHRAVESKIASLEALQRASDEISRIRLGTDQGEVLDRLAEQAVVCLPQAFMSTIQLYDEKLNELRIVSVYSNAGYDRLLKLVDENRRPLVRRPGWKIGIAGRAFVMKEPQLAPDVKRDADYYEFSPATMSELAVPLLTDDNRVLGVLNVESKKQAAFTKDDEQALMTLAKLVVATIQNAEQYRLLENAEQFRQLEETRMLVNSSTTLAWLGMASSVWGHSVAGHALDIRDNLKSLWKKLNRHELGPAVRSLLEDKLSFIDEMAEKIRQKPITAILSYDEVLSDISINKVIEDRVRQLWSHKRYKSTPCKLDLAREEPRVRCSPDWIRRMLEILIDNAVNAMAGTPDPLLTISTMVVGNQVEIEVTDTGPGIPREIKYKLFRQRIDRHPGSKGLGIGLLMVQAIAQTYRGGARVGRTGPEGTTMSVRLPVVEHS